MLFYVINRHITLLSRAEIKKTIHQRIADELLQDTIGFLLETTIYKFICTDYAIFPRNHVYLNITGMILQFL